jgi:hypothetical protein
MDIWISWAPVRAVGAPVPERMISIRRAQAGAGVSPRTFITASLAAKVAAKCNGGSGPDEQ